MAEEEEHNGAAFRITGTRQQDPSGHYQKTRSMYLYANTGRVLSTYAATGGADDAEVVEARRNEYVRRSATTPEA